MRKGGKTDEKRKRYGSRYVVYGNALYGVDVECECGERGYRGLSRVL